MKGPAAKICQMVNWCKSRATITAVQYVAEKRTMDSTRKEKSSIRSLKHLIHSLLSSPRIIFTFRQLRSLRKQKMKDNLEKKKHTHRGDKRKTVIWVQGFHATFRANAFVPRLRKAVGGWVMERSDGAAGALHTLLSGACARPRQRNR